MTKGERLYLRVPKGATDACVQVARDPRSGKIVFTLSLVDGDDKVLAFQRQVIEEVRDDEG
jgi:hypothetical protein